MTIKHQNESDTTRPYKRYVRIYKRDNLNSSQSESRQAIMALELRFAEKYRMRCERKAYCKRLAVNTKLPDLS